MQGTTVSVSLPFLHLQKMCVGGGVKCQQLSLSSNQEISCSLQFFSKVTFGKYKRGPVELGWGPCWHLTPLPRSTGPARSLCAKEGKTSAATSSGSVGTLNRDSNLRVVTLLKLSSLTSQTGPGPPGLPRPPELLYLPNRPNFWKNWSEHEISWLHALSSDFLRRLQILKKISHLIWRLLSSGRLFQIFVVFS